MPDFDRVQFERDGYAIVHELFDSETRELLLKSFTSPRPERDALSHPAVRSLIRSKSVSRLLAHILGSEAVAVRGIFFEKTVDANWKVTWHQDLTIAVRERHELQGFGPWSMKGGIVHVQPPTEMLEKMVALRLHLDDNTEENGPLRVIPGTHRHGRFPSEAIDNWKTSAHIECLAPAGSAVVMRPLLLHSSSASNNPHHRRVLHLEFANFALPAPLSWYEQIALGT